MLKLADLPYALAGNEPENVGQRAYSHFYYYPPAARFAKINLGCTEQELFTPPANENLTEYDREMVMNRTLNNLRSSNLIEERDIIQFFYQMGIDPLGDRGNLIHVAKANVRLFEAMSKGWCRPAPNNKVRAWQIFRRQLLTDFANDDFDYEAEIAGYFGAKA